MCVGVDFNANRSAIESYARPSFLSRCFGSEEARQEGAIAAINRMSFETLKQMDKRILVEVEGRLDKNKPADYAVLRDKIDKALTSELNKPSEIPTALLWLQIHNLDFIKDLQSYGTPKLTYLIRTPKSVTANAINLFKEDEIRDLPYIQFIQLLDLLGQADGDSHQLMRLFSTYPQESLTTNKFEIIQRLAKSRSAEENIRWFLQLHPNDPLPLSVTVGIERSVKSLEEIPTPSWFEFRKNDMSTCLSRFEQENLTEDQLARVLNKLSSLSSPQTVMEVADRWLDKNPGFDFSDFVDNYLDKKVAEGVLRHYQSVRQDPLPKAILPWLRAVSTHYTPGKAKLLSSVLAPQLSRYPEVQRKYLFRDHAPDNLHLPDDIWASPERVEWAIALINNYTYTEKIRPRYRDVSSKVFTPEQQTMGIAFHSDVKSLGHNEGWWSIAGQHFLNSPKPLLALLLLDQHGRNLKGFWIVTRKWGRIDEQFSFLKSKGLNLKEAEALLGHHCFIWDTLSTGTQEMDKIGVYVKEPLGFSKLESMILDATLDQETEIIRQLANLYQNPHAGDLVTKLNCERVLRWCVDPLKRPMPEGFRFDEPLPPPYRSARITELSKEEISALTLHQLTEYMDQAFKHPNGEEEIAYLYDQNNWGVKHMIEDLVMIRAAHHEPVAVRALERLENARKYILQVQMVKGVSKEQALKDLWDLKVTKNGDDVSQMMRARLGKNEENDSFVSYNIKFDGSVPKEGIRTGNFTCRAIREATQKCLLGPQGDMWAVHFFLFGYIDHEKEILEVLNESLRDENEVVRKNAQSAIRWIIHRRGVTISEAFKGSAPQADQ